MRSLRLWFWYRSCLECPLPEKSSMEKVGIFALLGANAPGFPVAMQC